MTDFSDLHQAVLTGDAAAALAAARAALDTGAEPLGLVNGAIAPAMNEAGRLFEEGEYFVPELLMAARATKGVFEILRPLMAKAGVSPMPAMQATLEQLGQTDLRRSVKVMVGGAPVTQAFASSIGADGCTENAAIAVSLARQLVGKCV